jgi:hypothetical protein
VFPTLCGLQDQQEGESFLSSEAICLFGAGRGLDPLRVTKVFGFSCYIQEHIHMLGRLCGLVLR